MENPFTNRSGESNDSDKEESTSETSSSKKTNARSIGVFARSSLDSGRSESDRSTPADREQPKGFLDLLKDKDSDKNTETSRTEKVDQPAIEAAKREAATEAAQAELEQLHTTLENSPEGTPEHAEAMQAAEYLEAVAAAIEDPEAEVDEVIRTEAERRIAEINAEELGEVSAEEDSPDSVFETAGESEEASDQPEEFSEDAAVVPLRPFIPQDTETNPPDILDSSTPRSSGASSTPPPPRISPPGTGGTGNGGGNGSGLPPFVYRPTPAAPENTPSTILPATQAETIQVRNEDEPERSNKTGAFLLGGALGYMIGRRGGRKRTEAKLKPEISKLETEVNKTKAELSTQEALVKRAAKEKERSDFMQKIADRQEVTTKAREKREQQAKKQVPIADVLRRTVEAPEAIKNPNFTTGETQRKDALKAPEIILNKRTEQLSTPELLRHAERLYIGGVNVRRLYESNQIDRRGLVKIVESGFLGEDIKKVFEEVELGFERRHERANEFRHDPNMNDSPASQQPISSSDLDNLDDVNNLPKGFLSKKPLPNTPDKDDLIPLVSTLSESSEGSKKSVNDELEPIDIDSLRPGKKTATLAAATVIAIVLALFFVWYLFTL